MGSFYQVVQDLTSGTYLLGDTEIYIADYTKYLTIILDKKLYFWFNILPWST